MSFQPDDAELTPGLILAWRMAIDSERTPEADIRLLGRFNWPWALTVALNEVERLKAEMSSTDANDPEILSLIRDLTATVVRLHGVEKAAQNLIYIEAALSPYEGEEGVCLTHNESDRREWAVKQLQRALEKS